MTRLHTNPAVIRLALLGMFLVGATTALILLGSSETADLLDRTAQTRWGVAAFFVVYVGAVVLLLPGTVGTLTAGAVLGFPLGFAVALSAGTVGATLTFVISRVLGREGVEQLIGPRLGELDARIGRNDFMSVLVLRMIPIVPFNALNYGAGLTSVRLSRYVPATALGLVPGTALGTFVADRADDPTSLSFLLSMSVAAIAVLSSLAIARQTRSYGQAMRRGQEQPASE